ncbi:MAG: GGDEF domain-containing protein [Dechloromonas sp.]|nr:MAG: GGDEF domain-containing protein [Dechloromonas sp.]
MLDLINHVVKISARRDRTEINSAMIDALTELFHPLRATIHRCFTGRNKAIFFPCAGFGPDGPFLRNAYLPDRQHCQGVEHDQLLQRCRLEASAVLERQDDGSHRIVFPIIRREEPSYMIDLVLLDEFSADQRVALMGLIEYFGNHIALLDYGEGDSLTGLASRKTFDKHLFELLGKAASDELLGNGKTHPRRRRGSSSEASHWLAVCDIDHFKQVNDNFGHLIGDEVLIMVAQVMRQAFRFDDQLFRFGGEEFVALLQPTDPASALATLERFRSQIAQQVFSRVGHVTVSIGFSRLQPHDTPADAIDRADEALYFAKRQGRNRIDCYEDLVARQLLTAKEFVGGEVELF